MLTNSFPLSSSNTQSGMAGGEEGENGRPKTDKPTESTVANQESGTDAEKKKASNV